MVNPCKGILLGNKKEWGTNACYVNISWKHSK